jgi:uncharacterized membrane protein YkoI
MNSATFRNKRVLLPTVAAVAALGIGGVAWASAANAGDLRGSERDRVANAATRAVGGTAVEVEVSDDLGEYYEVEVRRDDGTEVDVSLDKDLQVVGRDVDDRDDDLFDDDLFDDRDDDGDDRALSASERRSAENAARNAVNGGTITDVEAGDDLAEAYEVEVLDRDNVEWDVELDADFKVLRKTVDD